MRSALLLTAGRAGSTTFSREISRRFGFTSVEDLLGRAVPTAEISRVLAEVPGRDWVGAATRVFDFLLAGEGPRIAKVLVGKSGGPSAQSLVRKANSLGIVTIALYREDFAAAGESMVRARHTGVFDAAVQQPAQAFDPKSVTLGALDAAVADQHRRRAQLAAAAPDITLTYEQIINPAFRSPEFEALMGFPLPTLPPRA